MRNLQYVRLTLGVCSIVAPLSTASLYGQTAPIPAANPASPTPAPTSDQAQLASSPFAEIVVTARRSAESAQTAPLTIAALNSSALREASVRTSQDLMFQIPGINLTGANSRENATYFIRGAGKSPIGPGSPAVVSYFAEVPLNVFGSGGLTYDLSDIQVLKGPQGTLFGRNTTGGAILFSPAAPTNDWGGYLQQSVGNYNYHDLEGAINVPIVDDKVALRVAGRLDRRDGYYANIGSGGRLDSSHSDQVRGSLKLTPVNGLTNLTIFDYRHTANTASADEIAAVAPFPASPTIEELLLAELAAQQSRGPRSVDFGDFQAYSRQHHYTLVNRTEVDLGPAQLVNIFGYQILKWDTATNVDGVKEPLVDGTVLYNQKTITDEAQLKGKVFQDKVEWLLGAFYYDNTPRGIQGSDINTFYTNGPIQYDYSSDRSRAVFGNLVWHLDSLLDGLSLNAGVRYTWDKYRTCLGAGELSPPYTVGPGACSASNPIFQVGTGAVLHTKSSAPTWTIGADWKVNRDVFVYAVTRRGYRGGGINEPQLGGILAAFQFFRPEKVTDGELGARTDWRIGKVRGRFNVSFFIAQTTNTQLGIPGFTTEPGCTAGSAQPISPDGDCNVANDPSGTILTTNVGTKTDKGIDIEGFVVPFKGFQVGGSASILRQSTSKFSLPASIALYGSTFNGKIPLISSPKNSGTAYVRYQLPLPESVGSVAFRASYFVTGKVLLYDYVAKGYSLADLRLDWDDIRGTKFSAGLFAKNVFNKNTPIAGGVTSPALPFTTVVYNDPRTYGLEFRYQF